MSRDKEVSPKTPKITTQYRSKDTMIYELECAGGIALDLHVSNRKRAEVLDDEWCVEAHHGHAEGAIVMSECAPTAIQALKQVALSWSQKAPELGLPQHDWDGVARVLQAVRAV
jgi:hypothetical protein